MVQKDKDNIELLFNELWNEFEPYIRKLCQYKLSSMPHCVDDCIQETFRALSEAMSSGTVIEHPKAWLSCVANNNIKDLYSQAKKDKDRIISLDHNDALTQAVFINFDDVVLSEDEILSAKATIVAQFGDAEKLLLEERFVKKKKIGEIAKIHSISEENVRQQIFRLKKKADKLIKDYLKQQNSQKQH